MTSRRPGALIGFPLALAAAVALAGCGGSTATHPQTGPAGTTAAATTGPGATMRLQAFFYRGNALVPVPVQVPRTAAVATAALGALFAGPPQGYRTAVPAGVRLESLAISAGRATAHFSSGLAGLDREGQAQVVYTLTQFPTIASVDGGPLPAGASRASFADLRPDAPIFVSSPLRGSTVSSPVHASGTASVFEGTVAVDVWSGGKRLRTLAIQASVGAPQRGNWSTTIDVPPGPAKLVFYEPSAENGQPLHATTVTVTVT